MLCNARFSVLIESLRRIYSHGSQCFQNRLEKFCYEFCTTDSVVQSPKYNEVQGESADTERSPCYTEPLSILLALIVSWLNTVNIHWMASWIYSPATRLGKDTIKFLVEKCEKLSQNTPNYHNLTKVPNTFRSSSKPLWTSLGLGILNTKTILESISELTRSSAKD